jgi:hypothetical protein
VIVESEPPLFLLGLVVSWLLASDEDSAGVVIFICIFPLDLGLEGGNCPVQLLELDGEDVCALGFAGLTSAIKEG